MGWGHTEEGKTSDVALEVEVNVFSNELCGTSVWRTSHPTLIQDFHICTFERGQSMCQASLVFTEKSFS
jgi:hypothetical protein